MTTRIINYFDHLCEFKRAVEYQLDYREISQLDHRENKVYTLGLSQLSVFIAVATNTDGFFSYQCKYMLYFLYDRAAKFLYDRAGTVLVGEGLWVWPEGVEL